MENIELRNRILANLDNLSRQQQEKLYEFIKSMITKRKEPLPKILKLAGSINNSDLMIMQKAIDEDCEKINPNDW